MCICCFERLRQDYGYLFLCPTAQATNCSEMDYHTDEDDRQYNNDIADQLFFCILKKYIYVYISSNCTFSQLWLYV